MSARRGPVSQSPFPPPPERNARVRGHDADPRAPGVPAPARRPWYRQPVLWLGAVLLAASLGGCVLMIVLGARYADEPLPTAGQVFKIPLARPAAPPDPPPSPPQ